MKKYVKPELVYEDFQVSSSVATCDLEFDKNLKSKEDCSCTIPGTKVVLFTNVSICNETEDAEFYCITNSMDNFTLLNS